MNILILPSWCPSQRNPLQGTFFLDQAKSLARRHPHWNVFFLSWNNDAAKLLTRHPSQLLSFIKTFFVQSFSPACTLENHPSNLKLLRVWRPVLHTRTPAAMAACLEKHAAAALAFLRGADMLPDIIHAHASMPAGYVARNILKSFDIPYILTEHMGPFPWPSMRKPDDSPIAEIRHAFAGAARVLAVSSSLAQEIRCMGLAASIDVLPNMVDAARFSLRPSNQHDGFTFLTVGWPSREKGTDILLKAFAKMMRPGRVARLHIVGDSPQTPLFQRLAADLKIANHVQWLGNVPHEHMPDIYASCDAFVLPSLFETFGVSYIEALCCGKPIIATRCGGPEDIVTADNGILVEKNNVAALETAMRAIQKQKFSPGCLRDDAVRRFGAEHIADKLGKIYLQIVAEQRNDRSHSQKGTVRSSPAPQRERTDVRHFRLDTIFPVSAA